MADRELSPRARRILFAVVTEYIETGLPVGSRTLARRHGIDLSAASIRNVLSDLDEAGYLLQPHTSAGRVPTDRAIRLFIDKLVEMRAVPPDDRAKLDARVAAIYATSEFPLRESGRLLSEMSGAAAVVGGRRKSAKTLAQLRFIPTRKDQLLAVLVFQDGTVENRFLAVEGQISESELIRVHNLLTDVIEGRTLADVRDLFMRRLADDRTALDDLRRRAFELGQLAVANDGPVGEVVIEGQARLIDMPEYADHQKLKKLVFALEEREEILDLLDRTLSAGAVMVFVGAETGELGDGQLSLVVAPYRENGEPAGAVGVLGPTRMDYAKVLPLVDATASAMSDALTKK